MKLLHYLFLACALAIVVSSASAEERDDELAMRELWTLKADDGRSHTIEAIALGRLGGKEAIFVVEGVHDFREKGSTEPVAGEYALWVLDTNGRKLSREAIADCPLPRAPSRAMIVPLPPPDGGAIVLGMFEKEESPHSQSAYLFFRVDGDGKPVKAKRLKGGAGTFLAAALMPDAKAVLLAGDRNFGGYVTKIDLDGETLWEKEYLGKTDMSSADRKQHVAASFHGIAPIGESGDFVAAGDFGKITTFGPSEPSVWLVRCDAKGNIAAETTFAGQQSAVCALEKDRFAVLYIDVSGFVVGFRAKAFDLEMKLLWETDVPLAAMLFDRPEMHSIFAGHGFVAAGGNMTPDREAKNVRNECRFLQYDADGRKHFSAATPVERETFLFVHLACGDDRAYVSSQTKGAVPGDVREAGIYEVKLKPLP